jgi:hypothetical protein
VTFPVFAEMPDLSIDEGEYVAGAEVGGRVICTITGSVTRELAAASGPVTIILTGVAEMEGSTGWLTSLRHEATVLSARELPDGAAATRGVVTVNERWILGVGGESVEDPAATSPDGPGL